MFGLFHHAVGQRLAEPDHGGPRQSAALAMGRKFGQRHAPVGPIGAAGGALHPPDIAVELEDFAAACAVVQAIDVLRDEGEARLALFEFHQGAVGGVGLRFGDDLAPPVVPFPHQFRIPGERFGVGEFFGLVIFPQSAGAAKRRHAALRRNPRAR